MEEKYQIENSAIKSRNIIWLNQAIYVILQLDLNTPFKMKMPINHTRISPSIQLSGQLGKLKMIAAISKVLGQHQLSVQALDAHDKLVDSYNSQLPEDKPKGFWRQFADNLTFRDLDTTIVTRLDRLKGSADFQKEVNHYSTFDKGLLVQMLQEIMKYPY